MLDLRNNPMNPLHGDYTVTVTKSYSPGFEDEIHPIAIAICKPLAEILHWILSKKNTWDDMEQTGTYCWIISRKFCLNHESYEKYHNPFDFSGDDEPFE